MADNVSIDPGTTTPIATDDVSGVQYQKIKIDGGGDGATVPIIAGQQLAAGSIPVVLTSAQITTLTPPAAITGYATSAKQDTQDTSINTLLKPASTLAAVTSITNVVHVDDNGGTLTVDGTVAVTNSGITSIDGKLPALGQALAAASVPVILPSATITTLTPPAAITGFATETTLGTVHGHVDSIDTKTPALGQALAAASVPVILPSATITTLTPPAAITGFATETTLGTVHGHVDNIDVLLGAKTDAKSTATDGTSVSAMQVLKQISASVQAPPSQAVTNAGTFVVQSAVPVNATRVQGKCDNADTTTARAVLAAIASNYVYITSFIISVAVAGNYWLEDADAAQLTPKFYLAANGGVSWTCESTTPYKTTTVNKAINVKGSIAGAVGVMLTGYSSTT